jgi:phosphatidylglycerophosphate synthase
MENKSNNAVRSVDVFIQLLILIFLVVAPFFTIFSLLIGSIWQLSSYALTWLANDGKQSEQRAVYWFFAKVILLVFAIGCGLMALTRVTGSGEVKGVAFLMFAISFIGGVILYMNYLWICIKELKTKNNTKPISHEK